MKARKPSRAAIIGIGTAVLIAVVGGAVGAVVATGGHPAARPPVTHLVRTASTVSPTTTTTVPPATTTTTPSATAATTATNAGTSAPTTTSSTASTGSTTSTTTTVPPATTTTTTPVVQTVAVPNVVGMSVNPAEAALRSAGFAPTIYTHGACAAAGFGLTSAGPTPVVATVPAGESQAAAGSTVAICNMH